MLNIQCLECGHIGPAKTQSNGKPIEVPVCACCGSINVDTDVEDQESLSPLRKSTYQ